MTPLDAARRLNERGFTPWDDCGNMTCEACGWVVVTTAADNQWSGHADDCPWLAMPCIVAALEAAEQALWASDEAVWSPQSLPRPLMVAFADLEIAMGATDDDIKALETSLKGDV